MSPKQACWYVQRDMFIDLFSFLNLLWKIISLRQRELFSLCVLTCVACECMFTCMAARMCVCEEVRGPEVAHGHLPWLTEVEPLLNLVPADFSLASQMDPGKSLPLPPECLECSSYVVLGIWSVVLTPVHLHKDQGTGSVLGSYFRLGSMRFLPKQTEVIRSLDSDFRQENGLLPCT